jgi:hypothetical protein
MKAIAVSLVLCFGSLAFADDFKTITGKEYKTAKVSRVEPDGIVITFSGGIVKIPFTELSPETQKKYGYDLQAAATYSSEQNQQQAALAQQRKADEQRRLDESEKYWSEHPCLNDCKRNRNRNPPPALCTAECWTSARPAGPGAKLSLSEELFRLFLMKAQL